jgi:hypothetical protein
MHIDPFPLSLSGHGYSVLHLYPLRESLQLNFFLEIIHLEITLLSSYCS